MDRNKMRIHFTDTSGKLVGYIIGYEVFNPEGEKIVTVQPNIALEKIIEYLLKDKNKSYVS